jgi:hypothetical protein
MVDSKRPGVALSSVLMLVVMLALLGEYVGLYLFTVEHSYTARAFPLVGPARISSGPQYRAIGSQGFWRAIFAPAHSLDQRIRPNKWEVELIPITSLSS